MSDTMNLHYKIGADLVAHCNTRPAPGEEITHDTKIWDMHYDPNWTSLEGDGHSTTGRAAHLEKYKWWMGQHTVHGFKATGPFAGATGFSVLFEMDLEAKDGSMPRTKMQEVGVYTVENGKIIREEFMYGPRDGA